MNKLRAYFVPHQAGVATPNGPIVPIRVLHGRLHACDKMHTELDAPQTEDEDHSRSVAKLNRKQRVQTFVQVESPGSGCSVEQANYRDSSSLVEGTCRVRVAACQTRRVGACLHPPKDLCPAHHEPAGPPTGRESVSLTTPAVLAAWRP